MNNFLPNNLSAFIWHFLRNYKGIVIVYVCIAMLAGCWGPFNSILIKYMITILSSSHNENLSLLTWPAALLVLNFIIFDNFTWRSIGYLNYKFQPVIKNQIISEVFSFILNSSNQFFHDNWSGRLSSQITMLADNIERILHRIAHRLSTLLHMDRILVFDKGKIIEDATHAELLNNNNLYKKFWHAQVSGFLPDTPNAIE